MPGHEKNGKWVSAHQHLSVVYVLVADEHEKLVQNQEETNGIKWIPFEQIHQISGEVELLPIYDKCLKFIESVKIKDLLREDAPNNKTMLQ